MWHLILRFRWLQMNAVMQQGEINFSPSIRRDEKNKQNSKDRKVNSLMHCWKIGNTNLSYQFGSVVQSCPTLCNSVDEAACRASMSITNSWSLLKLLSIELVMPSSHLILCHPLLLLPSIFPSIRVFSNESVLHISWPKYWSFSFSISLSNEYLGLISYRIDWFDLLAVQGTLKNHLQQHNWKASILQHSAFFMVQCSHPYMTTGKAIALTRPLLAK